MAFIPCPKCQHNCKMTESYCSECGTRLLLPVGQGGDVVRVNSPDTQHINPLGSCAACGQMVLLARTFCCPVCKREPLCLEHYREFRTQRCCATCYEKPEQVKERRGLWQARLKDGQRRQIGKYWVINSMPLGHGTFADVYHGQDPDLPTRPVALKLLKPEYTDRALLEKEAQAYARLQHTHIAQLYDYGTDSILGQDYLVLQYVDGKKLSYKKRWEFPAAWQVFKQIGAALMFVHAAGLVHRDVSPNNILLRKDDQAAVLIDFGLARAGERTQWTQQLGTAWYAAPELWEGKQASPASDLYALGCVLAALLQGGALHAVEDTQHMAAVQGKHARGVALEKLRWEADVPDYFVEWLGQVVHPDAGQRFESVAAAQARWDGLAQAAAQRPHAVLREEHKKLQAQAAEQQAKLAALTQERVELQQQLAERSTAYQTLTQELAKRRKDYDGLQAQLLAWEAQLQGSQRTGSNSSAGEQGVMLSYALVDSVKQGLAAFRAGLQAYGQTLEQLVQVSAENKGLWQRLTSSENEQAKQLLREQVARWQTLDQQLQAASSPLAEAFRALDNWQATQARLALQLRGLQEQAAVQTAAVKTPPEPAKAKPVVTPPEPTKAVSAGQEQQSRPSAGRAELDWVWIAGGAFEMGSADGDSDEKPVHRVEVSGFWLARTPVTNAQFERFVKESGYKTDAEKRGKAWGYKDGKWQEIAGANWRAPAGAGSSIAGKEHHPVVSVNWDDAMAFCKWGGYRLPSEAQWEYAARGRAGRKYAWGNAAPDGERCNYDGKEGGTTAVGKYSPAGDTPEGLQDMTGNVWEWCEDWYATDYYSNSPQQNPLNNKSSQYKVLRGGGWSSDSIFVRASLRYRDNPSYSDNSGGFRCSAFP
jgi:sulfatase modifying factor 1